MTLIQVGNIAFATKRAMLFAVSLLTLPFVFQRAMSLLMSSVVPEVEVCYLFAYIMFTLLKTLRIRNGVGK